MRLEGWIESVRASILRDGRARERGLLRIRFVGNWMKCAERLVGGRGNKLPGAGAAWGDTPRIGKAVGLVVCFCTTRSDQSVWSAGPASPVEFCPMLLS